MSARTFTYPGEQRLHDQKLITHRGESRRMKIVELYEDDDHSAGPRCLANSVALSAIIWVVIAAIWMML